MKTITIKSRAFSRNTQRNISWKELTPPYSHEEELTLLQSKHDEYISHIRKKVKQYKQQDYKLCSLNVEDCNPDIKRSSKWKKTKFFHVSQEGKETTQSSQCQRVPKTITLDETLELLLKSNLICIYCNHPVYILYMNWREPKQWTLDRIDNSLYHTYDNCVISCLQCNLKRREKDFMKFKKSKQIHKIVQVDK